VGVGARVQFRPGESSSRRLESPRSHQGYVSADHEERRGQEQGGIIGKPLSSSITW